MTCRNSSCDRRDARRLRNERVDIGLSGDNVSVVLVGSPNGREPPADELADASTSELGREIDVDLRTRLEVQQTTRD